MGKKKKGNNNNNNDQQHQSDVASSTSFFCPSCSIRFLTLKCFAVFIFSVAAFLSALFFVLPLSHGQVGFDADDYIKLTASVQAHFKLHKPVSELVPYIPRIEYDVSGEIGVPSLKVAVLSMHHARLPNMTDVVFGFLPDPINSSINPVYLSVLKSTLVELFLQECNMTLTSSIFGELSSFEILKFPGGITMIPEKNVLMSQIPQVLFNFTLNSTINDIKDNIQQLKEQLKSGLLLTPDEIVNIQVKSKNGSTKDPPVTVDASVSSDRGTLLPERLRQLAQTIKGSPPKKNLGLDHTIFGKVKEISLSSFLNNSLDVPVPTPSPYPGQVHHYGPSMSPSPFMAPSYSPAISPTPEEVPSPPLTQGKPRCGGTDSPSSSPIIGSPLVASSPQIPPSLSPFADMEYGSRGSYGMSGNRKVSRHVLWSASSDSSRSWKIQWLQLFGFLVFLLFWIV